MNAPSASRVAALVIVISSLMVLAAAQAMMQVRKPPSKVDVKPINRTNAEHYAWGDCCDGWHLVKEEQLSVIEEQMPPGTSEVRHFHKAAQQFFYVLSGEAVMQVEDRTVQLSPGSGVRVPPGALHQIKNASGLPVRFLVISQPPSHGDRVDDQPRKNVEK